MYDEENGNFYLHHDILLAAYPLCLAWMDCVPQLSDSPNGHRMFFSNEMKIELKLILKIDIDIEIEIELIFLKFPQTGLTLFDIL